MLPNRPFHEAVEPLMLVEPGLIPTAGFEI
jgi:hypothetical protein